MIIIGDVTPGQMTAGNPDVFKTIKALVDKGTGLLMIGGLKAFGDGGWQTTELADLMPVTMEPGQIEEPVKIERTEAEKNHFLLRLADDPKQNDQRWAALPPLEGMTRLGQFKQGLVGAVLLYSAKDPILATRYYGKGRTAAFAGDTTFRWIRPPDGPQIHARFWKQIVLWLAQQEEAAGNVWVKPAVRRLLAGTPLDFNVGVRGKGDVELQGGRFEARVIGPDNVEKKLHVVRQGDENRGIVDKTDLPGEYRLVVTGAAKDRDGEQVSGEGTARFMVTQEDAEMSRRAADHESLRRLAAAGGGTFHRGDEEEFAAFLHDLELQPLPQIRPRIALWPDWRATTLPAFLPSFFIFFVALIALEWTLRRRWGLV